MKFWLTLSLSALFSTACVSSNYPFVPNNAQLPAAEAADPNQLILPADLRARWEAGDVVMIDVRTASEYQKHHVKGALSIPLSEMPIRYNELKQFGIKLVVLYCACPSEQSSNQAARIAAEKGIVGLKVLKGGIAAWESSGLPTE